MAINITITEDMILEGKPDYEPKAGPDGIKYEVEPGKTVTIKKVTPALVKAYNKHAKTRGEDGKPDPKDKRSSHEVATARMPTITEPVHKGLDWDNVSMAIIWRIVEDFLSLSSPKLRPETESSLVSLDQ